MRTFETTARHIAIKSATVELCLTGVYNEKRDLKFFWRLWNFPRRRMFYIFGSNGPVRQSRSLPMKTIKAMLPALLFAGLAACNTVEGAGRDVEEGGEAISNTAQDAEQELSE